MEFLKEPVPVHLAQAMCYAYIYANQQGLSDIGVQMTYCNLETEEIKRFQNVYPYEELERWFLELAGQYEKWARYQISWRKKRNASIRRLNFRFLIGRGKEI